MAARAFTMVASNSGALYPAAASYVADGGRHTLVPLTEDGRALGELLGSDRRLREPAVRHGFRPQGAAAEFTAATSPAAGRPTPAVRRTGGARCERAPRMPERVRPPEA
ncbi:hypothetical protein RPQ07_13770 [Streptomyces sp. AM8-1-1]|nr:hypothetical protein [Streptomyces sp. AM8-1-1]WNO77422.1 hypothetical protein RPQ07_13770 [Streptomyces sp. AM8-1-1]